jgi:DNA-binding transcriptional MerR regulator
MLDCVNLQLFEIGDAARELKVSTTMVGLLVKAGRLPVAATTPRGLRLFDPDAVEALRRVREQRGGATP